MSLRRHLKIVECDAEEDFVNTALKVAFATTDMKTVNQHFGSAAAFAVYLVDSNEFRFFEAMQFEYQDQDGNEDKLKEKLNALQDCIAVYSQAVGASAIAQLKMRHIQPFRVSPGDSITGILESLQEELRLGTNSWLNLAVAHRMARDPGRFAAMEAEGWEE